MRLILQLAACALIGFGAISLAYAAPRIFPPCVTEDSSNCFWDASTRGNGRGASFLDIAGHQFYAL